MIHDIISLIAHYAIRFFQGDIFSVIFIVHSSNEGIQLGHGAFLESLGLAHKNGRSTSWSLKNHLEKVEKEGQNYSRPNPDGSTNCHAPQQFV